MDLQRSTRTDGQSSRVLPWKFVAIVFAALAIAAVATAWLFERPMIPAALAGTIMGFFGTVLANRARALFAGAIVLLASLAGSEFPAWMIPVVIAPLLCAFSGWEIGKTGTRAHALGLLAWIMLIAPAGNGSALELFAAYIVPLLAGSLLAAGLGAEAIASKPPAGTRYGRAHAIALAIGLATSIILSWQFNHPGAHWIMTLFVVRALDDPGTHRKKALWTGLATMLGAVTAALVTLMPLPPSLFTVLGALFLLIGLRLMPLPDAKSSLLMSAGVVLATAPTLDAALYRGGAAFFASLLAIMLSYASAVMTERLERTRLVEGGRDEI